MPVQRQVAVSSPVDYQFGAKVLAGIPGVDADTACEVILTMRSRRSRVRIDVGLRVREFSLCSNGV